MSTQHTPGPWMQGPKAFKPGTHGLQDVIAVAVKGQVIAHVNDGFGAAEADARLIAAAPDLLAALRALVTFHNARSDDEAFIAQAEEAAECGVDSVTYLGRLVGDAERAIAKAAQS
jgi:hypothetical protein